MALKNTNLSNRTVDEIRIIYAALTILTNEDDQIEWMTRGDRAVISGLRVEVRTFMQLAERGTPPETPAPQVPHNTE